MLPAVLAISVGASAGALLRWQLGHALNSLFPHLPLGTLTANLVGGYFIGIAMALFASHPQLSPEWRLLVITGFLGGLTTFSTFSAEVVTLLQEEKWQWAFATISTHVLGSVLLTVLGFATIRLFQHT